MKILRPINESSTELLLYTIKNCAQGCSVLGFCLGFILAFLIVLQSEGKLLELTFSELLLPLIVPFLLISLLIYIDFNIKKRVVPELRKRLNK